MIYRIRIIRDPDTQEEISRQILDITSDTFYYTNVYEETQLPDESVESPNKILVKPNIDIRYGDWILKDNVQYKIRKIEKITYQGSEYLIKVEY